MHAEHGGLDAQVDVFGDDHDARFGVFFLKRDGLAEDGIVRAAGQGLRKRGGKLARLEEQAPGRRPLAVIARVAGRQREAVVYLVFVEAAHEVVEKATDLAHVARLLGKALLVRVELFEHHHGQEHVVFLEAEDGGGVVHEHVRVEHEEPPLLGGLRFAGVRSGATCSAGRGRVRETSPLQELPPHVRAPSRRATRAAGCHSHR